MTPQTQVPVKANLPDILEDLFLVLNPKEKEVIMKRFELGEDSRFTLEKIGQEFAVTRERIRQIEKVALSKLRRTSDNTKLSLVAKTAKEILDASGGVMREDMLITEILKKIGGTVHMDGPVVRLALSISTYFETARKNLFIHPYWRLASFSREMVETIAHAIHGILEKKKDIAPLDTLVYEVEEMLQAKGVEVKKETIISVADIDRRFKRVRESIGLMSWRHINPKSIRDKAYIILKQAGEPIHFMELANRIIAAHFDKKAVTTQAVHNELIRDELFVLVGRGIYALKEWGFKSGTVSEIIEDILRKKSPLTKQEIIAAVLKQRQVKKGTISLNLQKDDKFARVGRATYAIKS